MLTARAKTWAMRASAAVMCLVMSGGILAGTATNVFAATGGMKVISGPTTLDFSNPPPMEEGQIPPNVGVGALPQITYPEGSDVDGNPIGFIAAALASGAISWTGGKLMDFVFGDIFPSKEAKMMDEVLKNQSKIQQMLIEILNTVKKLDYKKEIDAKRIQQNDLWEQYNIKMNAIKEKDLTIQERKDLLKGYFDGTGKNYVMNFINLYVTYTEGKNMINSNIFATYDAYALYNYWWEHDGYNFRDSMRMLDLTQFMQMWTLAYAVCEAHSKDNTSCAAEARAAQRRLMDCISNNKTGQNDIIGIVKLLEKSPVDRQPDKCWVFQVPGARHEFYIPSKQQVDERYPKSEDEWNRRYVGWHAYDALYDVFFRVQDGGVRHDVADYYATLAPIELYYHNAGSNADILQIIRSLNPYEYSYVDYGQRYFGFMQKRQFRSDKLSSFDNDFIYTAYVTHNPGDRYRTTAVKFWLDGRDDNDRIKRTLQTWPALYRNYLLVCETKTYKLEDLSLDIATEGEMTDTGAVVAVNEGGFTLQADIPDTDTPPTEQVRVGPNTQLADGTPLGMENLQALVNCKVEVSGTYHYQEGTMDAKTIKIVADDTQHEVTGTVVSTVANAVTVEEAGGITNSYFLPNKESDIPAGSQIALRYHWQDGIKTVDSYEVVNGPMPGPIDDPVPTPVDNPVDGPVPGPINNPVDDPVPGPFVPPTETPVLAA